MRIMRGELWVDPVGQRQQPPRIADIADVGGLFAGEYRESGHPFDLCPFDFSVPIGPLDQSYHDLAIQVGGQIVKRIYGQSGALAISLHHDPEPVPAFQRRVGQDRCDHVQRQGQAIRLFCVDVEPHACRFGQ